MFGSCQGHPEVALTELSTRRRPRRQLRHVYPTSRRNQRPRTTFAFCRPSYMVRSAEQNHGTVLEHEEVRARDLVGVSCRTVTTPSTSTTANDRKNLRLMRLFQSRQDVFQNVAVKIARSYSSREAPLGSYGETGQTVDQQIPLSMEPTTHATSRHESAVRGVNAMADEVPRPWR